MGRALLVLESPDDRLKAVTWIGKAPVGTRVEFKASKRTLPQNDMMWALLTEVAQQIEHGGKKYDPEQWKAIFLHAFGREISFLPSLDLKTFLPIELSSADLSKDEMTDFIEFIMKEGSDRGVIFRDHRQPNQPDSGDVPSSPDTADDPATASSAAADENSASPPAGSSAATLSDVEWLQTAARMLSAATHVTGDTDADLQLLNNQRLAVSDLCPAETPQPTKDKAGSIYRQCKECVLQKIDHETLRKLISGIAGISEKELSDG
jgi:hypothetical protein